MAYGDSMLTAKGKYGLKAMVHLAAAEPGRLVPIGEIAADNAIPRKFLDTILGELRNAGLLRSRKGPGGGYALARAAVAISLGDIIRALDGPLAPISCASVTAYRACDDCEDVTQCPVRQAMLRVRNAMSEVLDQSSLASLRPEDALVARDAA